MTRPAMLTHAQINARFAELDAHPVLMRVCLDGWLAWPIVKERLWLLCRAHGGDGAPGRPARPVRRLASGLAQLARIALGPGRHCPTAVLYTPRHIPLPDGRTVHPNLGDIAAQQVERPWLHYLFGRGGADPDPGGPVLDHDGLGALAAVAARLLGRDRTLRAACDEIVDVVAPALPEIPAPALRAAAADALARFRARRRLTRWLLRRFGVRRMLVLDPDAKVPEVAAAKDLGFPVTEVQHGMFSAREPEYSWTAAYRSVAGRMPLPDRVVVFGPLWRRELRRAGYRRDEEILSASSPVIGAWRNRREAPRGRLAGAPLVVLFPSQRYVREAALGFWSRVLELQEEMEARDLQLRIKVHPAEAHDDAAYRAIEAAHGERCTVVPVDRDGLAEMVEADLVAGYTSLAMMEAVGLGLPVVGLRGDAAREGFCATFDTPELADVIVDIESPEAFVSRLAEWRRDGLDALAAASLEGAARVFDLDAPPIESVIAALGETAGGNG